MPSGLVHARTSAILSVPACALALGATNNSLAAGLACAAGCLSGILLTPDLDQESISSSEYWLIKWTLGIGFLWTMLWYPYARLCKHRSAISHFPFLGTAGRLLYLGLFVALALQLGWQPPSFPLDLALWALAGLVLSDSAHWAMDMRSGDHPRRRGRA